MFFLLDIFTGNKSLVFAVRLISSKLIEIMSLNDCDLKKIKNKNTVYPPALFIQSSKVENLNSFCVMQE